MLRNKRPDAYHVRLEIHQILNVLDYAFKALER